ncbi:MAG: DNA-binding response regulator [Bacteroidetes bacterium SW_9_63_38]|nr:MAG: DNA-binding response regulator [Bacteroidetes bacterium SW_9_63_38]
MLISTLIVEDHDVTRQGLEHLLENELDARVIGTTGDGLEAISVLEEREPDLLVLDLGLPGLNGLDILRRIRSLGLPTKVVVLSMHGEDSYVTEAFELGARGYVLKGSPLSELTDAIKHIIRGEKYVSSDLSEDLITSDPVEADVEDRFNTLTDREREVLQLTAEGNTSREIGDRLGISHRTVEKHRENIQAKLELRNIVEMAAYAHQRGLLEGV